MSFLKMTIASLKMFFRDKQALFWSLALPLIFISIFGLVAFDEIGNYSVGIVDYAQNEISENLVSTIEKIDQFDVSSGDYDTEFQALEEGERSFIIIIPQLVSPQKTNNLTIYYQEGDIQQGPIAFAILKEVLNEMSYQITQTQPLFRLQTKTVEARNLEYIDFLIPGIIAMAIMQMGIIGVATVIVTYREKEILKRLMATPLRQIDFLGSQVITRLVTSIMQAGILLGAGVLIFEAAMNGSFLLFFMLALLGGVVFLAFGFAVSGFAKTVDTAQAMAQAIGLPMVFLGGTFFPQEAMPEWLGNITQYLPLTYLADGLRLVMNEGAGFVELRTDILMLSLWGVIAFLVALIMYRWE